MQKDRNNQAIAEVAEAASSDAHKHLAERVNALTLTFPPEVMTKFLSITPEQRGNHLNLMQEVKQRKVAVRLWVGGVCQCRDLSSHSRFSIISP